MAAAPPPAGPTTCCRCSSRGPSGIDPTQVNYVTYDGGGELLPALLGEKVAFGASGVGEFIDQIEAGQLRVLAVSGAERVDVVPDAPTFAESGIDLEFTNWRGWVAPPEIEDADRDKWIDALTAMHDSAAWQEELEKQGWTDAFITGDDFGDFLDRAGPDGRRHPPSSWAWHDHAAENDATARGGRTSRRPAAARAETRTRHHRRRRRRTRAERPGGATSRNCGCAASSRSSAPS